MKKSPSPMGRRMQRSAYLPKPSLAAIPLVTSSFPPRTLRQQEININHNQFQVNLRASKNQWSFNSEPETTGTVIDSYLWLHGKTTEKRWRIEEGNKTIVYLMMFKKNSAYRRKQIDFVQLGFPVYNRSGSITSRIQRSCSRVGGSVTFTSSGTNSGKPVLANTSSTVTPG
jgi:hypothetical protein